MTQNTSHAVMAQRIEAHDSLDDFPTPPWATRAFCEHVLADEIQPHHSVWEPACNRGYMAKPLKEYFGRVLASDVHLYDGMKQSQIFDFLMPGEPLFSDVDWIITNPPFRLAAQFIQRGLEIATVGVAVIVRTAFIESVGRYNDIYRDNPPTIIAFSSERIPMVKGRYDPKASTATSYSWLIWIKGQAPGAPLWIPPCRRQLERPTDERNR